MAKHYFINLIYLSRQAKAWRKGQGKRSSSRIGRKRKSTASKGATSRVTSPSEWISSQDVPNGWIVVQHDNDEELKLCQIFCQNIPDVAPLVVSRSLIVKADCSWILHVNGHQVDPQNIPSLSNLPSFLDLSTTLSLLHKVSQLNTCVGNCDARLIHLATQKKNHQFLSFRQEVIAFLDKSVCVSHDGQQYPCTIRRHDCHLLSTENRCTTCSNYRKICGNGTVFTFSEGRIISFI